MSLNQEITEVLKQEGCNIVGFADLRNLPDSYDKARKGFDFGIVMGETYSADGLREFLDGKFEKFANSSGGTYATLDRYSATLIKFLKSKGFKVTDKYLTTTLTQKTVGTLAGLGWIGRCALLTTQEVGCGLRLTTVLTNAPVECAKPITKSQCPPDCTVCADICPANAIKGGLWEQGVHRDEFFYAKACRKMRSSLGDFCGLCIAACPYTQKGLGYEGGNFDVKQHFIKLQKSENKRKKSTKLHALGSLNIVDIPEENRKNVVEIANPDGWCVALYKLHKYKNQTVTIKYSAEVKRVGAEGELRWQVNNPDYPAIGTKILDAETDVWHSMSGEWTGVLADDYPIFYMSSWENNSDKTTYYIDKFVIDVQGE